MPEPQAVARHPLDVLIVDDDEGVCEAVSGTLRRLGHAPRFVTNLGRARMARAERLPDMVFLDLRLPDGDGLDFLEDLKTSAPHVEVVVITGFGDVELAVRSMRLGAIDLLEKPFTDDQIAAAVRGVTAFRHPDGLPRVPQLIGSSDRFLAACRAIQLVAQTPATTALILGESGTGKELAARAIHGMSERASGPFVAVNCAALTESLLEAELFGYEKGAFTGAAVGGKPGLFEAADRGTILLDEIGELAPTLQAKLLRTLQERTVKRVGALDEQPVDVRVVASTNRDLEVMVRGKEFRQDLFYRLNVMPITLPPLRGRGQDVLLLAHHFLTKLSGELGKSLTGFTRAAAEVLLAYRWPGNVRELKNVIEHAAILSTGPRIDAPALSIRPGDPSGEPHPEDPDAGVHLRLPDFKVASAERALIERTLAETSGHKTKAAELLGINRATLYNKLKAYGLD